ncbi:hypothetical protein M8C21_008593 [Ambrosia artemisiifolia]|uniref:Uncharacterized protein n=1 Tax=Ambrosia artemisiifolia TaxID=4212 RepID=A0AAD5G2B1_AMBAR|nr:hypothetical protein M8C21_008593 [Ambrosia artemisiifolia]
MDGHNNIRKKSLKRSSSAANKKRRSSQNNEDDEIDRMIICNGGLLRYTRPFQIGFYSPGTEPDRIPYHLYLLVKEAVDLMNKTSSFDHLTRVEKKIRFFCDFFYSHLPLGWKYDRDNATFLIAGCDTFFAKAGPKYNISGYAPLGYPLKIQYDCKTKLATDLVFEIMSLVHSRKTPAPESFIKWDETVMSFYCKLCSCFGIDYQHLEAASEDDVILMNMGKTRAKNNLLLLDAKATSSANKRGIEKISSNKDSYMFQHMRKLGSSDEAFELSKKNIRQILQIVRSQRLPPQTTFTEWNEYQISFYCKMCSCFGIDYQHLEAA